MCKQHLFSFINDIYSSSLMLANLNLFEIQIKNNHRKSYVLSQAITFDDLYIYK